MDIKFEFGKMLNIFFIYL